MVGAKLAILIGCAALSTFSLPFLHFCIAGNFAHHKILRKSSRAPSKATPLLTVPGNHDYWILGEPAIHTQLDQFANGHMQFYAQDTKAAEFARPGAAGAAAVPFNFSNDPTKGQLPALENAFQYHQIGNLGVVGFSGAYTLEQSLPYMKEACTWFGEKAEDGKLEVAMMVGHWDVAGMGASDAMATPGFYEHMKVLPGCKELDAKGMLKFFMGHTHCNVPHPHVRTAGSMLCLLCCLLFFRDLDGAPHQCPPGCPHFPKRVSGKLPSMHADLVRNSHDVAHRRATSTLGSW